MPRVVVVGDVHGAHDALVEILREVELVGPALEWTGGATHLVSVGDLLDRGSDGRRVLELFMRLESEAAAAGGRVHVLLGNHELMNLVGDLRYVSSGDFEAFAADEDPSMRAAATAAIVAARDPRAEPAELEALYPPGFFAREAAFAPSGRYGAWLLSRPTLVVINDTAFVHGGLPAIVAELGLELNAKVRAALRRYLDLRDRLAAQGVLSRFDRRNDVAAARAAMTSAPPEIAASAAELLALADAVELGMEGPHWYRGSVYCKPLLEEPTLDEALERLSVRRAIVGHTPAADGRMHSLYDGKLIVVDTGMLFEHFRGRPSALVLERDALEVRYLRPSERANAPRPGAVVAYGRTEAELAAGLARGTVTTLETGPAGRRRVVLEHEGATVEATFVPRERDGVADLELAAAALDDLLGTALVAPAVPRTVDGREGALKLRFPDAVTEAERVAEGQPLSGWCPIEPQLHLMRAFDLLIGNRARTPASVAFRNGGTDLISIEQSQAFGTERTLRVRAGTVAVKIAAPLAAALRALDEDTLMVSLGAWLDARRVRALLARRDRLLEQAGN